MYLSVMKQLVIDCTPLAELVIQRLVLTGDCVIKPINTLDSTLKGGNLMDFYGKATPERSAEWDHYLQEIRNDWE
jgi:hypothetical protein